MGDRTANDSEVFSFDIINDVILAIVQTAQLQGAVPSFGKERVVHLFVLADDVSFGQIKTNIIESTQILTPGETLLLVELQPLAKCLFAVGRQVESAVFLDQRRQHKLRAHHTSNTK